MKEEKTTFHSRFQFGNIPIIIGRSLPFSPLFDVNLTSPYRPILMMSKSLSYKYMYYYDRLHSVDVTTRGFRGRLVQNLRQAYGNSVQLAHVLHLFLPLFERPTSP